MPYMISVSTCILWSAMVTESCCRWRRYWLF